VLKEHPPQDILDKLMLKEKTSQNRVVIKINLAKQCVFYAIISLITIIALK